MSKTTSFYRTVVFKHTLSYVGLFIVMEALIFGVLYWSTISVYERRENAGIHLDADELRAELAGLELERMVAIVTLRSTDEPGEVDEYMLATDSYEYLAGNVKDWPAGVVARTGLIDVSLGRIKTHPVELHRVLILTLPSGHNLLVGRNLTELQEMRDLISRALLRVVATTVILGFAGGYAFSRRLAGRLGQINKASRSILEGNLNQRMPSSAAGDEFDELSDNLNEMLDRIEALMEGMRAVSENIAHDLRKPLSRLRSRIELTLMGPRDIDAYHDALMGTVEELDDVLAMFNALLTIAMAESGASREFERVDLADIAASTVELYEPAAEEAGLTLKLECRGPVDFTGNPHLISQTLANLLDNAIKYAKGSGDVTVNARKQDGDAVLVVADRGPGIPQAFRERALDRFTRLEQSRSKPGSGLGLSLVRAVCQLHGGSVQLDDNNPGLKVTVRYPLERISRRRLRRAARET